MGTQEPCEGTREPPCQSYSMHCLLVVGGRPACASPTPGMVSREISPATTPATPDLPPSPLWITRFTAQH